MEKKIYQLNEIRKGQTGTGLLIEKDGHIIGNSDTVKQIREDLENPSLKLFCPEKFIVSAVFQKYGIKSNTLSIIIWYNHFLYKIS